MGDETVEDPLPFEQLVDKPDESETIINIAYDGGQKTLALTRKAKQSMCASLDASSNQPTAFFRWRYVGQAVSDILGIDFLEFCFSYLPEDINWDTIVPGQKDTYPKAQTPSEDTFKIVRTVHLLVQEEKDEEAKANGLPKSGVQSYITYKQKWKYWRDLCVLFLAMNQGMAHQTILDLMTGLLKLCNSMDALDDVVKVEVKKFKDKLKRQERKRAAKVAIEAQLSEAKQKEEEVEQSVQEAVSQHEKVIEKRRQLENMDYSGKRKQRQAARASALKSIQEEATDAAETLQEAEEERKKLRRSLISLRKKKRKPKHQILSLRLINAEGRSLNVATLQYSIRLLLHGQRLQKRGMVGNHQQRQAQVAQNGCPLVQSGAKLARIKFSCWCHWCTIFVLKENWSNK